MKGIVRVIVFTGFVFVLSAGYFLYAYTVYPSIPERETFFTEVGEGLGELAIFGFSIIYGRTILKLLLGKGRLAHRLLPDYNPELGIPLVNTLLGFLNRTHVYVGIATVAVSLLHMFMMGIPMHILFFPAVFALIVWQAVFGLFLAWRYSPAELKRFSLVVHAQFVTGIMIGIFAGFGHLLIDD